MYIITLRILSCSEVVQPIFYISKSWRQASLLNLSITLNCISLKCMDNFGFKSVTMLKIEFRSCSTQLYLDQQFQSPAVAFLQPPLDTQSPSLFFLSLMFVLKGRALQISVLDSHGRVTAEKQSLLKSIILNWHSWGYSSLGKEKKSERKIKFTENFLK